MERESHYTLLYNLKLFSSEVDDKSIKLGGKQLIRTQDGYAFPLDFNNELPYLRLRSSSYSKWEQLQHAFIICGVDWDHTIYDNGIIDSNT